MRRLSGCLHSGCLALVAVSFGSGVEHLRNVRGRRKLAVAHQGEDLSSMTRLREQLVGLTEPEEARLGVTGVGVGFLLGEFDRLGEGSRLPQRDALFVGRWIAQRR